MGRLTLSVLNGTPAMAPSRRSAQAQGGKAGGTNGRGRTRCACLHELSQRPPAKDPQYQSTGTPQWRDQAAHRSRRHLPNEAAITRLVGAILLEQNDEWAVQRARYMTLGNHRSVERGSDLQAARRGNLNRRPNSPASVKIDAALTPQRGTRSQPLRRLGHQGVICG